MDKKRSPTPTKKTNSNKAKGKKSSSNKGHTTRQSSSTNSRSSRNKTNQLVTKGTPKKFLTKRSTLIIVGVVAGFIIFAWLISPTINFVSYQRQYGLESYKITGNVVGTQNIVDTISNHDDKSLTITSDQINEAGTYAGSYSFTNESTGKHAINGWTTVPGFNDPTITDLDGGHKKVIDLNGTKIQHDCIVSGKSTSIEFWFKINSNHQDTSFFSIMNGGLTVFSLIAHNDSSKLMSLFFNQVSANNDISAVTIGQWYRSWIIIDFSSKSITFYIDDVVIPKIFNISSTSLTSIVFSSSFVMIDAIGFEWDTSYTIGDNRYPLPLYSLNIAFTFSLPINPSIESVQYVTVTIDADDHGTFDLEKSLFITHDNERYSIVAISDSASNGVNGRTYKIVQYKSFLIQSGIAVVIDFLGNSVATVDIDYLTLNVEVSL